jgi:hypothetical protein
MIPVQQIKNGSFDIRIPKKSFCVLRKWWRRRDFLINKIMIPSSFFMIDPIEILYFVVLIMIDPMQTRFAYKKKSMEELAKIF